MKRWTVLAIVSIVILASVGASASTTSLFGTRFRVGTEIQFRVEDDVTWWWGCCSCAPSQVLGWRVVSSTGTVVYSVVHDAAVPAASWVGSWTQVDASAQAVPAGQYMLYVDTSVGTLSRCFTLYSPCACSPCTPMCWTCSCDQTPSITNCSCRASLVFVDTCTSGCLPFFGWFGCGCNSCSGCSGTP